MHQHALQCYNDPESIMSVIRNIHAISEDFLIEYFGTLANYIGKQNLTTCPKYKFSFGYI